MASFLQRISSVIISDTTPKVEIDQIPPTSELVDCSSCPHECGEHPNYPSYLELDHESPLLGSMLPYGRHLMIGTGVSDWAERIEEDMDTLAAQIHKVMTSDPIYMDQKPNGRIFITNTSMLTTHSTIQEGHDVIILPENIIISNVKKEEAELFYQTFLTEPLPTQPIHLQRYINEFKFKHQQKDHQWEINMNPYGSMILICSHRKRDKRCGVTAPILAREFDHYLRENDIEENGENGTVVTMCSHVGGHKYAGNIIIYTHQGTRGIWYGRVTPHHCQQIVEKTVLKGKVIKELYRGAMTHSYGPISNNELTCPARIAW
ncbi:unnamed protein product [Cunninghamella blakesleeana]